MSIRSKVIIGAAVASFIASPAFAQAFDPYAGTGNATPSFYDNGGALHAGIAAQNSQVAVHRNGLNAFASVPLGASGSDSSALTGGGSVGYNNMLQTDRW